ncbi:chromosomal replication initiator protein DnaA [Candidatus Curtissbacteria bacterium]|nr:chromosomal replication initiator protein DnaA [Candidatus Curtissbacteria bacterium]
MEGQKVWNTIISDIRSKMSSSTFRTWFGGASVLDYSFAESGEKKLLIIGVRNNFLKEQIETRYRPIITETVKKRGFEKTEVIFVVSKNNGEETNGKKEAPLFSGIAPAYFGSRRQAESLNPLYTFETFVVGSSNNLAYLASGQVSANLGSVYNPLFIYGPSGVGKTHLLQACGNEILSKFTAAKILYASAEKFTNDFIESLGNRSSASFRQKYRSVDLLLMDDVQFFSGKESTQDEFFNTFNELFLSGKQIILVCDRHPRELGKLKDRLISRFLGGMAVDIQRPDYELRVAIIRDKCKQRGINLDEKIVDYVAQSVQEIRELEGILIQVLLLFKISGNISLEQIKLSLEKNNKTTNSIPTVGKVVEAVCRHFKTSSRDICSSSRKASLVFARQVLMYLLRNDLGLSLDGIGQIIGGRDHSTVLHGIEKIARALIADQSKRDEISRIRLFY